MPEGVEGFEAMDIFEGGGGLLGSEDSMFLPRESSKDWLTVDIETKYKPTAEPPGEVMKEWEEDKLVQQILRGLQSKELAGQDVLSFQDVHRLLEMVGIGRRPFVVSFTDEAEAEAEGKLAEYTNSLQEKPAAASSPLLTKIKYDD